MADAGLLIAAGLLIGWLGYRLGLLMGLRTSPTSTTILRECLGEVAVPHMARRSMVFKLRHRPRAITLSRLVSK